MEKKLNTQRGWTLQESRVDFASLCTVVPWDLHSQNQNSKTKLLRSSRIVPWEDILVPCSPLFYRRHFQGFILAGSLGLAIGWDLSLSVEKAGSLERALHLALCQHGDWVLLSGDPGRKLNCV